MIKSTFTLLKKQQLTHDVYELVYTYGTQDGKLPPDKQIIPGQYVMFQLAPGLNRAYSIASFTERDFTLIIKRIDGGRGSPIICDALVGSSLSGLIPLGHFTLRDTENSKCFIWTGTGFAPLYCQLLACRDRGITGFPMAFVFGVRNFQDSFYSDKIIQLGQEFWGFEYIEYFSRETEFPPQTSNLKLQTSGYVTDWITSEVTQKFREFYLCGSPAMVHSAREKLAEFGVERERIFFEQY